jgi:DNA-binding NarL/FixJ family response regulator
MMHIRCCTKDDKLLDQLKDLYGVDNVTSLPDVESLQESGAQQSRGIVIIDLKYNILPRGRNFVSPTIVLAVLPVFAEAFKVLQLGGRGYGNRRMRQANLQQAIENVNDGQIWLPPSIISKLIDVVGKDDRFVSEKSRDKVLTILSKREQEVALFVAKGMSNQEVADTMFVSLRTIKAHLSSIYEKTGLRNRLELGLALA